MDRPQIKWHMPFGMNTYSEERRASPRIKLDSRARYRFTNSFTDISFLPCRINNIGLGGINIIADQSFIVGDKIEVSFSFVDLDKIKNIEDDASSKTTGTKLHMEVIHISGKKAGGKFSFIHQNTCGQIADLVESKIFVK